MDIEIVGQSARDAQNPKFTPSRILNMYSQTSDNQRTFRSVLGAETVATIEGSNARDMVRTRTHLHIAQSGKLWRVFRENWGVSEMGDIIDAEDTTIAQNADNVVVCAGGEFRVLTTDGMIEPDNIILDDVTDCTSFAQRTILLEGSGRRIQWSNTLAPLDYSALDFATTEAGEDLNLRLMPVNGSLWIFKERSIEQWIATDSGFSYITGSKVDTGLLARNLIVKTPNAVFWVGSDGKVRSSESGVVSTVAVESAIETNAPTRCTYYVDKGAEFACIIFSDRPAWCLNLATNEWHERQQATDEAWDVRGMAQTYGEQVLLTSSGELRRMIDNNTDNGAPLIRDIFTRTIENGGRPFEISKIQFPCTTGEQAQGTIQLRVSRDRGRTWGNRFDRSMGSVGEYRKRVTKRRLGWGHTFNLHLRISEPVPVFLSSVIYAEVN